MVQPVTVTPVILCGGVGSRLWPLSTAERPKQFLTLEGQSSMLAETAARVQTGDDRLAFADCTVVGNERHRDLIRAEVPNARLILEPLGRNSAPAVAAASLIADPDDLLLIMPADHAIRHPERFVDAIATGLQAARDGSIVTFGIEPDHPATGYGYIDAEPGDAPIVPARQFVEKPNLDTANAYLKAGHYLWNAGIFLFRAGTMVDAFRTHAPEVLSGVEKAIAGATGEGDEIRLEAAAFAACPGISVDYAIMEQFKPVMAVPVDMGWSDVGDFRALWEMSSKDAQGNVLMGPVTAVGCRNCYIRSEGAPISVEGLEDMIVVEAGGHRINCPMADAQSVKKLAEASA